MSDCWLLWYCLGVPGIAFAVSTFWLSHFAEAFMQSERSVALGESAEPNWSLPRRWLFWLSGLPLIGVGMRLISRVSPTLSCSGTTLVVVSLLNGVVWGVCVVTLLRMAWIAFVA